MRQDITVAVTGHHKSAFYIKVSPEVHVVSQQ